MQEQNINLSFSGKPKRWGLIIAGIAILAIAAFVLVAMMAKNPAQDRQQTGSIGQPDSGARTDIGGNENADEKFTAVFSLEAANNARVGEAVSISVRLDTGTINTVAAQAVVRWDPAFLKFKELDTDSSVFPMQVMRAQDEGMIDISRAIPGDGDKFDADDGFTGTGEYMILVFEPLQPGTVRLWFDDLTKAYIDDGWGTAMESDLLETNITIEQS